MFRQDSSLRVPVDVEVLRGEVVPGEAEPLPLSKVATAPTAGCTAPNANKSRTISPCLYVVAICRGVTPSDVGSFGSPP